MQTPQGVRQEADQTVMAKSVDKEREFKEELVGRATMHEMSKLARNRLDWRKKSHHQAKN